MKFNDYIERKEWWTALKEQLNTKSVLSLTINIVK